jgi:hypothetical protein
MEATLPAEALERYRDQIDAITAGIDAQERDGADPEMVAAAVERALTCARPRPRVPVGTDARVSALFDRLVPDRARAPLLARLTRP